jgi:hypothetical protein
MWYIDVTATSYNTTAISNLLTEVANSGVKYVRIGGIDPNFYPLYSWNTDLSINSNSLITKLVDLVNLIHSKGMEPIIQVGYNPPTSSGCTSVGLLAGKTLDEQSTIAGNLVARVNKYKYPHHPVKYWIIANEPDLPTDCDDNVNDGDGLGGFGYKSQNTTTEAANIAGYIKEFSRKMKNADKDIMIVGPEVTTFSYDSYYSTGSCGGYCNPMNQIMSELVSSSGTNSIMGTIPATTGTTTNAASGKYYIDVLSFHFYPSVTGRADVINNPTTTANYFNFTASVADDGNSANTSRGLLELVNASGRTISNLKLACTEFNILTNNGINESSNPSGVFNGYDNRSFIAGQWLAEILAQGMSFGSGGEPWMQFMNFWSMKEGGCTDGMGYISNCGTSGTKRSTYHHFEMVAENFEGVYYAGNHNMGTNVKAFGSQGNSRLVVMVMNQDDPAVVSTPKTFALKFDNINPSSGYYVKMNFASPPTSPSGTFTIDPGSTLLLVYTCNGTLAKQIVYKQSFGLTGVPSVTTGSGTILTVDAGADKVVGGCCSTTLSATSNGTGVSYQWWDGASSVGTTSSITIVPPTLPHTYRVTATNGTCTTEDFISLYPCTDNNLYAANCCTRREIRPDLDETSVLSALLSTVPNPTADHTTINFTLAEETRFAEIQVMDAYGKVVARYKVEPGTSSLDIDCSHLANGIYFTSLIVDQTNVGTQKLMIAK